MGELIPFRRRAPLPSTVSIIHELRLGQRKEEAKRGGKPMNDAAKPEVRSVVCETLVPLKAAPFPPT
jgi:hypothetical protein